MRSLTFIILTTPLLGCGAFKPGRASLNVGNSPSAAVATATTEARTADLQSSDISVDAPSQKQPVTSGAALSQSQVRPGEETTLIVRLRTAEPWYIYAAEGPTGVASSTVLELSPPAFISKASDWSLPAAETKHSPLGDIDVYKGDFRFSLPLSVAKTAAAGTFEIACTVRYQACSDRSCLPPTELQLVVPLTIVPD
jgi:DsbC/DsbD-like thiol-disulfide interchange protein